jgi:hypothetical protein
MEAGPQAITAGVWIALVTPSPQIVPQDVVRTCVALALRVAADEGCLSPADRRVLLVAGTNAGHIAPAARPDTSGDRTDGLLPNAGAP